MACSQHPRRQLRQHAGRSTTDGPWLIALALVFLALGCVAGAVPVTTWAAPGLAILANTTTAPSANATTTTTFPSQAANTTINTTSTLAPSTTLTTTTTTTSNATTTAPSTTTGTPNTTSTTTTTTPGNVTTSTSNGTTIASTVSSTSTTAKPHKHKGRRRLTGGEIFAIVFILGVVLYLVVGMLVRRRRGYTGLRVIPNHSFWTRTSENVKGRVSHIQQWFRGEREEDEAVLPRNPYGSYGSATDVL